MRRVSCMWVPHFLTKEQMKTRVSACKKWLKKIEEDLDILSRIVMGDKSWKPFQTVAEGRERGMEITLIAPPPLIKSVTSMICIQSHADLLHWLPQTSLCTRIFYQSIRRSTAHTTVKCSKHYRITLGANEKICKTGGFSTKITHALTLLLKHEPPSSTILSLSSNIHHIVWTWRYWTFGFSRIWRYNWEARGSICGRNSKQQCIPSCEPFLKKNLGKQLWRSGLTRKKMR